jgi:long-subunit acyl-CoA synthetase (AMP-forming)
MENLKKLVTSRLDELKKSKSDFQSIFKIIHLNDKVLFEKTDGYKVQKMTYDEHFHLSIQAGSFFKEHYISIPTDSYIGLKSENNEYYFILMFGLLMAGYRVCLLNSRLPISLNEHVLGLIDIKSVIYESDIPSLIESIKKQNFDTEFYLHSSWANHIALSTTATSLNIKVCEYSGERIVNQILNSDSIITRNNWIKKHYNGNLKLLTILPFYHVFGLITNFFFFALFGRTLVLLKDQKPETIIYTIRKHSITHIFAVPLYWNLVTLQIVKQVNLETKKNQDKFYKGINLSIKLQTLFPNLGKYIAKRIFANVRNKVFGESVQFCISGGHFIKEDSLKIINGLGYPLYNGFGMSEVGITSLNLNKKAKLRINQSIGKPFTFVDYKIDEQQQLLIRSNSLASRVISQQGSTTLSNEEYFQTSDLVKCVKGEYYMLGRSDDVVSMQNGESINPDIIEGNLLFDNVINISVLGYRNKLTLIIEIEKSLNLIRKKTLLEQISNAIELYKIEQVYITYDAIINPNAIKVSRKQLLQQIQLKQITLIKYSSFKKDLEVPIEDLDLDILERTKNIFSQVLHVDNIDPNAHFLLELGGTSLEYFTLIGLIEKEFGFDMSIEKMLYTVHGIVTYISSKNKQ